MDVRLIEEGVSYFEQLGTIWSLEDLLLMPQKDLQKLQTEGIYAFLQNGNKLFEPMTFVYIGRSDNVQKRLVQHKNQWLPHFAKKAEGKLFFGWISANSLWQSLGKSVGSFENTFWRSEKELGLKRLKDLWQIAANNKQGETHDNTI